MVTILINAPVTCLTQQYIINTVSFFPLLPITSLLASIFLTVLLSYKLSQSCRLLTWTKSPPLLNSFISLSPLFHSINHHMSILLQNASHSLRTCSSSSPLTLMQSSLACLSWAHLRFSLLPGRQSWVVEETYHALTDGNIGTFLKLSDLQLDTVSGVYHLYPPTHTCLDPDCARWTLVLSTNVSLVSPEHISSQSSQKNLELSQAIKPLFIAKSSNLK